MGVAEITIRSRAAGTAAGKASSKKRWKLSDSLREKIVEYARADAAQNVYMGNKFLALRKSEVAKVAPNRAALIGKISQAMSSGSMADMKKIQEADERWIHILFGEPYEAEFQSEGTGSAIHVYDENGDEILTYTGGVGWHEKESKAETQVHGALKSAYYDAYRAARQEINAAGSAARQEIQAGSIGAGQEIYAGSSGAGQEIYAGGSAAEMEKQSVFDAKA